MLAMDIKKFFELLKAAYTHWSEDKASRLAAALAYYTTFSIAPLLIVVIAIAGLVFRDTAQQQIIDQISGTVGADGARMIAEMIKSASKPSSSIMASVIGIATLLMGAGAVFGQLQDALNTIWEVAPKPGQGIMETIRHRFLSFAMVLGVGFLLLVSLVLSAALAALGQFLNNYLPIPEAVMHAINLLVSFAVFTLLFAMMYRALPDAEIDWGDVWIGAGMTSLLFAMGKFVLGLYLGHSAVTSSYGAAGSFVLILLWVYYAAQILFFGAEFTKVYAFEYGSRIVPSPHAVPVTEEMRAQQGMPSAQAVAAMAQTDGNVPSAVPSGILPASDQMVKQKSRKLNRDYAASVFVGLAATLFLARRFNRTRTQ